MTPKLKAEHFNHFFSRFAQKATHHIGHGSTFALAIVAVFIWALSGGFFHYSSYWHDALEVALTVITFLIVILLQHSQNNDTRAIQMKLDELIKSQIKASNELIAVETLPERAIQNIRKDQLETKPQNEEKEWKS